MIGVVYDDSDPQAKMLFVFAVTLRVSFAMTLAARSTDGCGGGGIGCGNDARVVAAGTTRDIAFHLAF